MCIRDWHESLLSFIGEGYFDHLGVFAYSQEENTKAALLDGQLPETVKQQRAQAMMRVPVSYTHLCRNWSIWVRM